MIKVGITGSNAAINRHSDALAKTGDILVTGCWVSNGSREAVHNTETGKLCNTPEQIIEKIDALILTDGGGISNRLAIAALRKAKHVFLYPSVIRSASDANQLIKLAREANVILQCGKTGKTGISGLLSAISANETISMIEMQHYTEISGSIKPAAINKVLLGDIEILNSLIHARSTSIKAKGLCMLSTAPEIINARLEYDNGCAVNYNCNLVAPENDYLITIVLKNRVLKYNLLTNQLTGWYLHHTFNKNENPIFIENIRVEKTDSLVGGLTDFFDMIRSGAAFLSIYDNGFESVLLTDRILEKVMKTLVHCT
jgi:hypothetical protein